MRVLLLQETDWLSKGPGQQHHLMDRLSLRSHKVRVIDFEILWRNHAKRDFYTKRKIFTNISRACKKADVTVIRPSIIKIPMLDYVSVLFSHGKEIYRQIEDFRPEIIIGFSILNANLGMRIARKNNIPFVYYLNDAVHTLVPLRSLQPIAKIIESETLKHADKVVVINEELREYAINLGADPERVSVIRAGIDSSKFNPSIDGSRIREKYGISKDDTVLFFMGWLYMFSGLREVAHSLLEVKDKHPNIKLLVVGKGDIYKELEELRERQGLNQLVLVSWQPYEKIPDYIAASDICLLPAYNNEVMRNIVPIKMYEYMACGKPVIATKLPGLMKEFGHNGVIYVDQPTKVLEKVIELVENGRLRDHGIKAREFVKNYDWYKITDEFQDILENVVSSSRENGWIVSRAEVAKLLSEADALILPLKDFWTPYLGMSSKLYEYQAVVKPTICYGEGQPAEYVKETRSGIVVKPGDYEAMAETVLYLKENRDVAGKLGVSGARYVENNLSIEKVGLKMMVAFSYALRKPLGFIRRSHKQRENSAS